MRLAFKTFLLIIALFLAFMMKETNAQTPLPETVLTQVKDPLSKVGSGSYRKFGFKIYDVTLWAPEGNWNKAKPYALQLCYTHNLSKDTVVDNVLDNIRDENVADDKKLNEWKTVLNNTLPSLQDGDTLVGISLPGQKSQLFYNGTKIASIDDPALSKAFFDIWLGDTADSDLREKLLNNK